MKHESECKALGIVIRRIREQTKISQDDLAYSIGMSRRHYGSIERGQTNITLAVLLRICKGLNVKASKVVDEIDKELMLIQKKKH